MTELTRRDALRVGGGLGLAVLAGPGFARPEVEDIVAEFTGGRAPEAGGLSLEVPAIAENASSVPVRVWLDAPMTEALYCEELIVLLERNPRPLACRFRFDPRIGLVDVTTRFRMAESQRVSVLARMSDGRILAVGRDVTVTGNSCSA